MQTVFLREAEQDQQDLGTWKEQQCCLGTEQSYKEVWRHEVYHASGNLEDEKVAHMLPFHSAELGTFLQLKQLFFWQKRYFEFGGRSLQWRKAERYVWYR